MFKHCFGIAPAIILSYQSQGGASAKKRGSGSGKHTKKYGLKAYYLIDEVDKVLMELR